MGELGSMPHAEYVRWVAFYSWEAHEKRKAADKARADNKKRPAGRGRRRR